MKLKIKDFLKILMVVQLLCFIIMSFVVTGEFIWGDTPSKELYMIVGIDYIFMAISTILMYFIYYPIVKKLLDLP
jgi:hypothetical protein